MTTDPLTAALSAVRDSFLAEHPALFISYGAGADIDEAFDEATAAAGNEHGYTGAHPSLAAADADTVTAAGTRAVPGPAAALTLGAAFAASELTPGVVHAFPVAVSSAFTRRRARVTLTDTSLVVPSTPGPLGHLDDALREAVLGALRDAGAPLEETEQLESVEVVRVRSRYKPVATPIPGKSQSSFALLDPATDQIVAKGFANAGEARRHAVAQAKVGPLSTVGTDPETAALEVIKVTRREGDQPLVRVARDRVRTTIVLKVVMVTEKNAARTKVAGWLFAGTDPAPVANNAGDIEAVDVEQD